jgi:pyridoxamine 5'-phosphate oxidase-like protein
VESSQSNGSIVSGLPSERCWATSLVSLIGYVAPLTVPLPKKTEAALETCYLAVHPDARAWLPGSPSSPHAEFWARMAVTQAYWIGGYTQQIGWINHRTKWTRIRRKRSLPGIGDGERVLVLPVSVITLGLVDKLRISSFFSSAN